MHRSAAMLAVAAVACGVLDTGTALAQRVLRSQDVIRIVRAQSIDPLGQPVRRGDTYLMRGLTRQGGEVTITVQARRGRVVSIRPVDHQNDPRIVYQAVPDTQGNTIYLPRNVISGEPQGVATGEVVIRQPAVTTSRKSLRAERARRYAARREARRAAARAARMPRPAVVRPAEPTTPAAIAEPPARAVPSVKPADPETTATTEPPVQRTRPAESAPTPAPGRRIINPDSPGGRSYTPPTRD